MPKVIIVGTAHISKRSVKEAEETILRERPKNVALELDKARYEALVRKKKWMETPISKLIRGGKVYFLLAYALLSAFERKLGEVTGVRPGDEMLAGARAAKKVGARVVLVDRPVDITFKRAWKMAGIREKLRLFKELLFSVFGLDEIDDKTIEELKKEGVMAEAMRELAKIIPSGKRVLVDERDEYIAGKLLGLKGKTVAVVGAGHKRGIEKNLRMKKSVDFKRLEAVPRSRFKARYAFMALSVLIIALFVWLGLRNPQRLPDFVFLWCVINIAFSAAGGVIALAHPVSIAAGALSSPITSLMPNIGAGWVAGIVEAKIKKPKVKDLESLRDLKGVRDFWSNRFTHLLLVAAFVNLGSMIGTFVALPYLISIL